MCSFAINSQYLSNEPERFFSGLRYAVATYMYLEILYPSTPAQPVTYSTGCDVNIQELNNRSMLVPQIELNHWFTKNNYERFVSIDISDSVLRHGLILSNANTNKNDC